MYLTSSTGSHCPLSRVSEMWQGTRLVKGIDRCVGCCNATCTEGNTPTSWRLNLINTYSYILEAKAAVKPRWMKRSRFLRSICTEAATSGGKVSQHFSDPLGMLEKRIMSVWKPILTPKIQRSRQVVKKLAPSPRDCVLVRCLSTWPLLVSFRQKDKHF